MRRTDWRDYKIVAATIAALIVAYAAWPSKAEPRQMFVFNAYICDTVEQLKEALDGTKIGAPMPMPEGCGYLHRPSPALIEELEAHESPIATVLIVKLTFPGLGEQYGWSAYNMKPNEKGA